MSNPSKRRNVNRFVLVVLAGVLALCGVGIVGLIWGDLDKADPEPSGRAAYLEALRAIDPGLVADEDRAIRRAEETCADIKAGHAGDELVQRVVARLSGGNATIDAAQAQRAIDAMRQHVCA